MKIYVWPDGTWCDQYELDDMLRFCSDDFDTINVPDDVDDVEEYLIKNQHI